MDLKWAAILVAAAILVILLLAGCKDFKDEVRVEQRSSNVWYIGDFNDEDPSRFLKRTCAKDKPVIQVAFGNDSASELLVVCGDTGVPSPRRPIDATDSYGVTP